MDTDMVDTVMVTVMVMVTTGTTDTIITATTIITGAAAGSATATSIGRTATAIVRDIGTVGVGTESMHLPKQEEPASAFLLRHG